MAINIIAACDNNYLIGLNGKLPWHIQADLKRFKALTTGHAVIMGRKTFESLGSKPLPDRNNFVVGSKLAPTMFFHESRLFTAPSLKYALGWTELLRHEEIFIIGGASLYAEAMSIADRVYLTRVHTSRSIDPNAGDEAVYFPYGEFEAQDWGEIRNETPADIGSSANFEFWVFERRK